MEENSNNFYANTVQDFSGVSVGNSFSNDSAAQQLYEVVANLTARGYDGGYYDGSSMDFANWRAASVAERLAKCNSKLSSSWYQLAESIKKIDAATKNNLEKLHAAISKYAEETKSAQKSLDEKLDNVNNDMNDVLKDLDGLI